MGKATLFYGSWGTSSGKNENIVQSSKDQTPNLFDLAWFLQMYLVCLYCAAKELANYAPGLGLSKHIVFYGTVARLNALNTQS